jgi:hypothetical protein
LKVAAELVIATGWDGSNPLFPEFVTLRKEYKEDWVTARGSTVSVLSGHTTTSYINTVKKSAQEYDKELLRLFSIESIEWLQILGLPFYFAQTMDWKKRREIISGIIGNINPQDVFSREDSTLLIEALLKANGWNVDNAKKSVKVELDGYKTTQATLKAQIEGYTIDESVTEEQHLAAAQRISSILNEISNLKASRYGIKNPKVDALDKEIATLEKSLNQSAATDNAELNKTNAAINESIAKQNEIVNGLHSSKRDAIDKKVKAETAIAKVTLENDNDRRTIASKTADKKVKLDEWYRVDGGEYKPLESILCDNCGHDISAKSNAEGLAKFNLDKATKLGDIEKKGLELKAEITRLEKTITDRNATLPELQKQEAEAKALVKSYEDDIRAAENKVYELKSSVRYSAPESDTTKSIRNQIQATREAITQAESEATDTAQIDAQIGTLEEESKAKQEITMKYRIAQEKIREKAQREKDKSAIDQKIAEAQTKEDALTIYNKTYLKIMDERLKAAFPNVTIRLVKENIKADSWDPDCTIMDLNGAPFETTNTASKFFLGLNLIENLRRAKGIQPIPVLMDDVEHITKSNRNFASDSQVICFIASDERSVGLTA